VVPDRQGGFHEITAGYRASGQCAAVGCGSFPESDQPLAAYLPAGRLTAAIVTYPHGYAALVTAHAHLGAAGSRMLEGIGERLLVSPGGRTRVRRRSRVGAEQFTGFDEVQGYGGEFHVDGLGSLR
jgi:hypothetical protein